MPERQLLNSLEEAGLILDKSGQIHHCNPRLRDLLQYDPAGKEIGKVFPEIHEDWIRSALDSPEAAAFVFQSASLNRKCLATILPSDDHFLFLLWPAEKQQVPFPDDGPLLGLLPFGLVLIDDSARVHRSNAAARRLLGVQDSLWNLNDAWKGARDSANRRRSTDQAPWVRALKLARPVRVGPVEIQGSALDFYCIPIQAAGDARLLVIIQDMEREHRNQRRLRSALELNRHINNLLMDLLRVPGPEDTIHRALKGSIHLINCDGCLFLTEESYGSRISFAEGHGLKQMVGQENSLDPWSMDTVARKEGAFLIHNNELLRKLAPGLDPEKFKSSMAATLLYEKDRRGLVLFLRKNVRFRSNERRILQLLVPALSAAIFKYRYEARLNRMATTDPLTGLLNRRRFFAILESAVRDRTPPALLQMDLDFFKQINDTLGHQAGDKVLEVLAVELGRMEDQGAVPARTGGEEFMILLRNDLASEYRAVAENLRSSIENLTVEWDPEPIKFTISIGATVHREGEKLADFYARADKLLYQAKETGRNRVCFESLPLRPNPKST